MKFFYLFTALFCIAVTLFSQNNISFQKDTSFTIYENNKAHLAFPDLTKTKDNKLLLVFREGSDHYKTGMLKKIFGSPDGMQWQAPLLLYDDTLFDDRDPSVAILSDGSIVVTFFKYVRGKKDTLPSSHHNFFIRSTDNGKNFSYPVQVDKGDMNLSKAFIKDSSVWINEKGDKINVEGTSSRVIEINGNILLPSYGGCPLVFSGKKVKSKASRISLFSSSDVGKTWKKTMINEALDTNVWLQEPALLKLTENDIIMHVRTAKETPFAKGYMAQSISHDNAKTWENWKYFDFIGHAPFLYELKNGILLSAFRFLNAEYKEQSTAFIYSTDKGKNWSQPIIIENCGENECGYPAITELENQKFLIVYYGNNGTAIKASIYSYK